jgi:hypothetical protein
MAFFTKTFATNQIFKIVVVPLSIFVLYGVFTQLRKVLDNISIITLTATYIEIYEDGQPQKFSWTEIKELTIEKKQTSKSEVNILTIKSDARTKEVNISTLDKSVDDIRGLIKNYRP